MARPKTKAKKTLAEAYPIPERVRKNILTLMIENRDDAKRIMEILHISESTWQRRMIKENSDPGAFTMHDIQALCDYWGITPDILFRPPFEKAAPAVQETV